MPLIIPPAKAKTYDLFGSLFKMIWSAAEDALVLADHVIVVGYSFPRTDHQSGTLFAHAFSRRNSMPKVSIVDPNPSRAVEKFRTLGISGDNLFIYAEPFSPELDIRRII